MTAAAGTITARPGAALAAGLVAVLLWGGTAIANKAAVFHMDPVTPGIFRSLCAGLIAIVIVFAARLPWPAGPRRWALLAFSGIASFAVWPMMLSYGLGHTNANRAALIMAVLPVFTGLIGAAVERRWPAGLWWAGVAVAACGTVLLISYRNGSGIVVDAGATLFGDLVILSGIAVCAAGYVAGARLTPVIGTWSVTFGGLALAVAVLLPSFLLVMDRTDWSAVGYGGWAGIAYMTVLSSIVGYALWFWSLGHGGIAKMAPLQFIQPIVTLLFALPILGEALTWELILSGTVILSGVALAQRARS